MDVANFVIEFLDGMGERKEFFFFFFLFFFRFVILPGLLRLPARDFCGVVTQSAVHAGGAEALCPRRAPDTPVHPPRG